MRILPVKNFACGILHSYLAREEQYQKFSSSNSSPQCSKTLPLSDDSSNSPADSCEEFTPKRPCTSQPSGTTVYISKDFLKKLGPAADRLNISNNVLTSVFAAVTNHGGGRHRASARSEKAITIKRDFVCNPGQINFDGKILPGLGGFGKVNRLAVVLVQEEENKILCITKTEDSTGKVEAEKVKEVLESWKITEKIIACGFDTTSSNTGVHKGDSSWSSLYRAFWRIKVP